LTPELSVKVTKIRLIAGRKGIGPAEEANIEKVGSASLLIVVVTLLPVGWARHWPVAGFVWHIDNAVSSG
jgi:hypothetical protein